MKFNNRILSRIFAGCLAVALTTTCLPVQTYAEDDVIMTERAAQEVADDTDSSVTDSETDLADDETLETDEDALETDDETVTEEDAEAEDSSEDVSGEADETADAEEENGIIDTIKDLFGISDEEDLLTEEDLAVEGSVPDTSNAAPYAKIDTSYASKVSVGTIRYVSQNPSSSYYFSSYWKCSYYIQPTQECGTASQSMALSYIGINLTPGQILTYGKGITYLGKSWDAGYSVKRAIQSGLTRSQLDNAIARYIKGKGKYSPPLVHVPYYSGQGHYFLIVGKVSTNTYITVDPWDLNMQSITFSGSSSLYGTYTMSSGSTRSEFVNEMYQYYNANASISGSSGSESSDSDIGDGGDDSSKSVDDTDPIEDCSAYKGILLTNYVNVRKKPGTSYGVIEMLNKYDKVTITGKNDEWCRVKLSDGTIGYIYRAYVGLVALVPSKVGSFTAKATYNKCVKLTWKKVSGASGYIIQKWNATKKKYVSCRTVGKSKRSCTISKLTSGKTYKFRVVAYVKTKGYKLLGTASTAKKAKTFTYKKAKMKASSVNMRTGAGTKYSVIKSLKKGTIVYIYGVKGSWYKIKTKISGKMRVGYVLAKYVKKL